MGKIDDETGRKRGREGVKGVINEGRGRNLEGLFSYMWIVIVEECQT